MKKQTPKGKRSVPQETIHFRLCHLCFHLNESPQEIHRCERCSHDYYSVSDYLMGDLESMADEMEDAEVEMVALETMAGRARDRGFRRLNGLVAVL